MFRNPQIQTPTNPSPRALSMDETVREVLGFGLLGVMVQAGPNAAARPFFPEAAYRLFPRGCTCPTGSGTCDWCSVFINGPEVAEVEIA